MKTINTYQNKKNIFRCSHFLFMLTFIIIAGLAFRPSVSQAQDTTQSKARKILRQRRVIRRADTIRKPVRRRVLRISDAEIRKAFTRSDVRKALSKAAPELQIDVDELIKHKIRPQNIIGEDNEGEQHDVAPSAALLQPLSQERIQKILEGADAAAINSEAANNARILVRRGQINKAVIRKQRRRKIRPIEPPKPTLDVSAFAAGMHAAFVGRVASYMWQLNQNGQAIAIGQWDWARRPQDGGLGWDPENRRMHVASVSKLITAIALVNLLQEKNISYNTPIVNYLPAYWNIGPNVDQITFRHLLRHRSGIKVPRSATDYWTMRQEIEAGVSAGNIGQSKGHYENTNYGLMRIMIPIINGDIPSDYMDLGSWHPIIDLVWDYATVSNYFRYVKDNIFGPSGNYTGPSMIHQSDDALAYPYLAFGTFVSGWDSGDLRSVSGGAGWIMSVDGVLDVMNEFRRGGGIVSPAVAQQALDNGFGIDRIKNTAAGKVYDKNGRWHKGPWTEQCVAFFLPDNMELVVFVNSPIGTEKASLRNLVRQLYIANLK